MGPYCKLGEQNPFIPPPFMNDYITTIAAKLLTICENPEHAQQEAWWLLQHITNKTATQLITHHTPLTEKQYLTLIDLVEQRIQGVPLQYLLQTVPFLDLTITVRPPILIPRPETEEWVYHLITILNPLSKSPLKILDLCTGSGCIALALSQALPNATIVGIDKNPEAIALAEENKKNNHQKNVTFLCADICQPLPSSLQSHIIVSNPPYLSAEEYEILDPSVKAWEDKDALVGGHDGMLLYSTILHIAPELLLPLPNTHNHIPQVYLEIGPAQEHALPKAILQHNKFSYSIYKDISNKDRLFQLTCKP